MAKESLRLKQDFLQSSIQFSLTMIELASTSTRNDSLLPAATRPNKAMEESAR
jgi:hypothetical protein